ncbi:unnamed protein product [Tuber aestivum]|uniref:Fungal lipase-type domain-containing protein n=1 Tax=Tuber aestivum TaxID=59557 RepID=A0A292PIH2_9PEZI|nr:unnamed protein product [Tuber aestivum]
MFIHKIWGTLWTLAELVSISKSAREPSPSGSQRSGGVDLESQWVEGVEGAARNEHSLEPLLGAKAVSGPDAPVWIDVRVSAYQLAAHGVVKTLNELFKPATGITSLFVSVSLYRLTHETAEEGVIQDELKLMKKNAERAFLAYCPGKIIERLATKHDVVTNENLGMKDGGGHTRRELFIIPENSVKIMKAHYPRAWAKSAFGITGIGAVVLVDEKAREIVVPVRGTIGLMNWITDAAILVVSARHLCKGCYMHSGFWVATREIHRTVKAEVKRLRALSEYRDFTLTVTGHSLGGAVAYLLRAQFAVDRDFCEGSRASVALVTFGQPKAGNRELATWVEKLPGKYLRVTYSNDLVVSLPASFGWMSLGTGYHYVHTRNEYHINPIPNVKISRSIHGKPPM